jgi:hypothetical protein
MKKEKASKFKSVIFKKIKTIQKFTKQKKSFIILKILLFVAIIVLFQLKQSLTSTNSKSKYRN